MVSFGIFNIWGSMVLALLVSFFFNFSLSFSHLLFLKKI